MKHPDFKMSGHVDNWEAYAQWRVGNTKYCCTLEYAGDLRDWLPQLIGHNRSSVGEIKIYKLRPNEPPEIKDLLGK